MLSSQIPINDKILESMRQCLLLKELSDSDFDKVVEASHARKLSEKTTLFEQDAPLTDLYLLVSGGIKLLRLVSNGNEKVFDIIQPGQTFAEAALFSGSLKYPVTAVTLSPSVVVGFKAQPYLELLKSSNELCIGLLGQLSSRLHWMVNEVDRLTLHNATFRLVDYLISQISHDGQAHTNLYLNAPKHVIASRLSIKPETLSRSLKELTKKNLIDLNRSQIEVLDVEGLRKLISLES